MDRVHFVIGHKHYVLLMHCTSVYHQDLQSYFHLRALRKEHSAQNVGSVLDVTQEVHLYFLYLYIQTWQELISGHSTQIKSVSIAFCCLSLLSIHQLFHLSEAKKSTSAEIYLCAEAKSR